MFWGRISNGFGYGGPEAGRTSHPSRSRSRSLGLTLTLSPLKVKVKVLWVWPWTPQGQGSWAWSWAPLKVKVFMSDHKADRALKSINKCLLKCHKLNIRILCCECYILLKFSWDELFRVQDNWLICLRLSNKWLYAPYSMTVWALHSYSPWWIPCHTISYHCVTSPYHNISYHIFRYFYGMA